MTLLYKPVSHTLITHLIANWIKDNYLTNNTSKQNLWPSLGQGLVPFNLYVNGLQIEEVKHFKYLGMWISSDLTWSKHMETVCWKARWVLGYIHRTFAPYCGPPTIIKFSLYRSQVFPLLDYTSVVWDPHLLKDKLMLESVHTFATRMASKSWSIVRYSVRDLSLQPWNTNVSTSNFYL